MVGLAPVANMKARPREITQPTWDILARLYKTPEDIDLFTGGLAEDHVKGIFKKGRFKILFLGIKV